MYRQCWLVICSHVWRCFICCCRTGKFAGFCSWNCDFWKPSFDIIPCVDPALETPPLFLNLGNILTAFYGRNVLLFNCGRVLWYKKCKVKLWASLLLFLSDEEEQAADRDHRCHLLRGPDVPVPDAGFDAPGGAAAGEGGASWTRGAGVFTWKFKRCWFKGKNALLTHRDASFPGGSVSPPSQDREAGAPPRRQQQAGC